MPGHASGPVCKFFCWVFMCLVIASMSLDTINVTHSIRDGQTIVSVGGDFELGFFSPGSSGRRYVGIWFQKIPTKTVVWVANRESPLLDSSGVLQVSNKSVLELVNGKGTIIWYTNSSGPVHNPIAELLNTGNLVIRDQNDVNSDSYLWQSFDYPCDSHLPGMKLGRDLVTGFDRFLTSWKSSDDPSPGSYTYRLVYDPPGLPQLFMLKGSSELFRDGPWTDIWFSEGTLINAASLETYNYESNEKEIYFSYDLINTSVVTNRYLSPYGSLLIVNWSTLTQGWIPFSNKPLDSCDSYAACGAFSICNITSVHPCQCMQGFVPKSLKDWSEGSSSDGCVPSSSFDCSISSQFTTYSHVKLPDAKYALPYAAMDIDECRNICLQNYSCLAYAIPVAGGGSGGCFLWFNTLVDIRFISSFGQAIYVRAIPSGPKAGDGPSHIRIAVGSSLLAMAVLCGATISIVWRKKRLKREEARASEVEGSIFDNKQEESELPTFALNVIAQATNYFSHGNKLGEGGYGPVYKGTLSDRQEIAVKRLSKDSKQGLYEFKNEALFIARLQHRNLVKLMGCCVEAGERMLIYEYMPNKSLDCFIFDQTNNTVLDWPKRFEIIKGIARGLLYLHQDSRLRIVHRDLKASNILLDFEMNPKISDFGMARSFVENDDEARTRRVVGTYGYMPPEYLIDGLFSVKSDVFSFGVLVLEIVSGKRNRGFKHPDHYHNLLGHAWMLSREGSTTDIVDPLIRSSSYARQMQRMIHIGLLCVQQHPADRPSMPLVTFMLSGDTQLPEPKQPGFFVGRNVHQEVVSCNIEGEITHTTLCGR